ncbi:EI24 domain-containing protein [soil metagenome]
MARPRIRDTTNRAHGVASEFFGGFATLFRGFAWWKRRPDLMLLGLVPAAIVAASIVVLAVAIIGAGEGFIGWLTPFADLWDPAWRSVLRIGLALALLIGFIVVAAFTFTTMSLLIGDWFYERIWRAVEDQLGGFVQGREPRFWRTVVDSFRLVVPAVLTAVLVSVLGLIPIVGTLLATVLSFVFSGRILARELTTRPMEARGLARAERTALLRTRPRRVLGFGVAVQLCFLIPGGAILVMPAAVAAATHLTRDLLAVAQPPMIARRTQ